MNAEPTAGTATVLTASLLTTSVLPASVLTATVLTASVLTPAMAPLRSLESVSRRHVDLQRVSSALCRA